MVGHARAQYALAIAYAEGRGVGRDLPLATEWLQLAADQGLADAQYALGVIREEGLARIFHDANDCVLLGRSSVSNEANWDGF